MKTEVKLPPGLAIDAHKGDAGRVLCVVGSPAYPGAAQLVAAATMRGGAGLVTLALFHPELASVVATVVPEAVYLDVSRTKDLYVGRLPREISEHRHDARLVGPGLGQGGHTRELVRQMVEADFAGPLLVDADALNILGGVPELLQQHSGPVVITPHVGEARVLLERDISADPQDRARAADDMAELARGVCVLKGRGTIVSDGTNSWTAKTGNPGMATAGSGDVLSGLMVAYLLGTGENYTPFDAACAAVHVHGRAGDLAAEELGQRALIARDLITYLPAAQEELEEL